MSADIDTMIHINEMPWHGLSLDMTANPPKTSQEIITAAKLDWETDALTMKTDLHEVVPDYYTLYRKDNNKILGVVKSRDPKIVQNADTFASVEHLLESDMDIECAASLGNGEKVFGCFKISQKYKLLDDDIDHYFVIINEHLKPDGKVTVLNTPIRVVCNNTLTAALSTSLTKFRIPILPEMEINQSVADRVLGNVGDCIIELNSRAESLVKEKTSDQYVINLLDLIFPFQVVDGHVLPTKANDKIAILRDTFMHNCMEADNLANYTGTRWQIFNALTDFDSHYFNDLSAAYDLDKRMKTIPGFTGDGSSSKAAQFLKMANQL